MITTDLLVGLVLTGLATGEAGGGYLWVCDALGRDQAFIASWMGWFGGRSG